MTNTHNVADHLKPNILYLSTQDIHFVVLFSLQTPLCLVEIVKFGTSLNCNIGPIPRSEPPPLAVGRSLGRGLEL